MAKWMSAVLAVAIGLSQADSAEPASEGASHASVGKVRADSIRDLIVGKWQLQGNGQAVVEFQRGGKLKVGAGGMTMNGTYKFLKDSELEVQLGINGVGNHTVKLKVKIEKNKLFTTEDSQQRTETFVRAK